MDDKTYSMGGIGFLALFFLIIIAFWGRGGNGFGWGNNCANGFMPWGGDGIGFGASSYGFQNYRATCDAEKAEIINTAATQYKTIEQAQLTRDAIQASASATQAKIDFYAYQAERDKNAELQRQVSELKSNAYSTALANEIKRDVADIRCNMLTKPVVNGLGTSCNPIITPYMFGLGNGCGCNGLV